MNGENLDTKNDRGVMARKDGDEDAMTPAEAAKAIAAPIVAMTPEQIAELLKAVKSDDDELLRKKAEYDAQAMKRAMKPENEFHPGISVYSHPEGERAHPKDKLRCQTLWVGFDEREEQLMPDEIRLLNALADKTAAEGFVDADDTGRPCTRYRCQRTDGSELSVKVYGVRADAGKMSRLEVMFPCRGEQKFNLPSKAHLLRQMLGELDPKQAEAYAEIARLRKELAAQGR